MATGPALLDLWRRGRVEPEYRQRWGERLAIDLPPAGPYVWFHAVSLGECRAAVPLIRAVCAEVPDERLLITCATPAGAACARAHFGDTAEIRWLPFDTAWSARRFVARVQPRVCVLVEAELWPNLLHALADVPVVLVSARISERSFRAWRRVGLLRSALASVDHVSAQDAVAAERYRALGAPSVSVGGDLKAHAAPPPAIERADRPTWIAACTHGEDEAAVVDTHAAVLEASPNALLVWAPRHPRRFESAYTAARAQGWGVARRSRGEAAAAEVLLVDTLGELPGLYGLAGVAFVSRDHNDVEAASAGVAVTRRCAEVETLLTDSVAREARVREGRRRAEVVAVPPGSNLDLVVGLITR